ncbi:hypothetical protein ACLKA6_017503 [Drosophila palustris]
MVRSWIYNIKKEDLIQYGIEFDIVLTGTVDAIRKEFGEWPLEFLEQVEWSAETYGLDLDLVPRAMPELLKGTALKWYIANNEHWRTWTSFATSFQEFFLPRDYFTKLLEEVIRRKQGVDEPFKRYMVEMQTLMRPLRFSKERERQQIYSCSLPDFRAFARPYQNGSLIELMQLAEEFEELERDRERLRQHT